MTVPELILAQARRSPAAVAIEAADGRLSYAELAAYACAVADELRGSGVGPGDVVAVALPRGVDLVPALLGVHLSGAAYLPLDPGHPGDRLDYTLRDSGARLLLTLDPADLPQLHPEARLHLSDVVVPPEPAEPVLPSPRSAAYVIYTSGSTGRPKGVLVGHRALANFVRSVRDLLGLPGDVVLPAITTVSFDIAGLELFVPLTTGGRVVVGEHQQAGDPGRLAALLARTGARFLQATPMSWRLLLETGWSPPPGFTVLCGGERLPAELAQRLLGDGVVLWDMYGPTETTVWSALTRYERGTAPRFHPIRETGLHLLDEQLEPVPPGGQGELYIGGSGLATGYLGRPGLTAQRFVADPASGQAGARLYRTGDIARRQPDGRIEILGRADDQIKVRGFRVEPGEIENVLATHVDVAAAAVAADDSAEGTRLIAYVWPADPHGPPEDRQLQRHLARSVPDYMIPAQFVLVEALPMTPNGKLDRAALPAARRLPAVAHPAAPGPAPARDPAGAAPASGTERQVAEVLAAVLERADIGLHDDFFALGGDSLRAVQAILWLNTALDTQVPISVLFETRTVYGLARLLDGDGPADPQLRPLAAGQPPRLSAGQWRLWLQQQLEPDSVRHNRSLAVRIPGPLGPEAVQAALTETLARHETLRTWYPAGESGSPAVAVRPAAPVPLTVEDGDPQAVLVSELSRPFDLSAHPPVRARAIRQGPDQCFLLLVVHEIAADARSRALIVRQLRAAFRGRPVTAPALRYADYAAWQRELAAGPTAQRHLDFWRMALAGLEPAGLRTDRPRPAQRNGRSAAVSFAVPPGVAGGLGEATFSHDAPLAIGLLTALFGVLARHTTGTDLTVGVTVDGRTQPELEHLVGMFENVAVFRVPLDGARTFTQLLSRVRETGIGALGHALPPLEDVVAATVEVTGPAEPGRHPLFDVSFALRPATGLSDLPLPDPAGAGSDLHCDLTEQPDGGLCGRLEYATALFDEATAVRLASDYVCLLGLVSAHPDLVLTELPSADEAVSPT